MVVDCMAGWEVSAADSQIYHSACQMDFAVLPGKYYLADAGFGATFATLVPYRNGRYHLKE